MTDIFRKALEIKEYVLNNKEHWQSITAYPGL